MKRIKSTRQFFDGEEYWETPSLAWIHRIRREIEAQMQTKTYKRLTQTELKKKATRLGLKYIAPPKIESKK